MSAIILKPKRDKPVRQKHPWIFSGAVKKVDGNPQTGETVTVYSAEGESLGQAAYSPQSNIRARMWSWDANEIINEAFLQTKLQQALALRKDVIPENETKAIRLVHAEADGLPGIIVDRYANTLVLQCLTAGAEYWQNTIADLLMNLTNADCLYERSDVDVRSLEGLPERSQLLRGKIPSAPLIIQENDLKFSVDITTGQKTGFYLDQRQNRQRVRELVNGCSVLNCFCYTGAFSVYALAGGAREVLSIDSSSDALGKGKENVVLNNLDSTKAEWLQGDVFQELRTLRDRGKFFDAIILDPPKFAPTSAQAQRAARGYKDINLLAFKLLRPGGLLFTFSCSGGISMEFFKQIVAGAALDAGIHANIIGEMHQGPDHPVALNFPESKYLKGLICHIRY